MLSYYPDSLEDLLNFTKANPEEAFRYVGCNRESERPGEEQRKVMNKMLTARHKEKAQVIMHDKDVSENERIFLSVIIPVYNTARWLRECLDSILAQTAFDLDIICVDDGSTDDSAAILAAYAKDDNRIKVLTQTNEGISMARNAGMEIAKGQYIWFFDSDDKINPEALESVKQAIIEHDRPEVICFPTINRFSDQNYHGKRKEERVGLLKTKPFLMGIRSGPQALQVMTEEKIHWHWTWTHFVRKDFMEQHSLRFLPSLFRHEDVAFMTRVYRDASSVLCIPDCVANHRIREGSSIDTVADCIKPKDVEVYFELVFDLYHIYSASDILQREVPAFKALLVNRIGYCQKEYHRLYLENPEAITDVYDTLSKEKQVLFDLLIRYPAESGKMLYRVSELETKRYKLYSAMIAPIRWIWKKIR